MFELAQGINVQPLQCRLELVITFLPIDGRKGIRFPEQVLTLPPFLSNVSQIPVQIVKLPNPLPKDEAFFTICEFPKVIACHYFESLCTYLTEL